MAYQHNTICVSKQRRSPGLQHRRVGIITMSVIRPAIARMEPLIEFDSNDIVIVDCEVTTQQTKRHKNEPQARCTWGSEFVASLGFYG
jgi:hypothetical protein